MSDHKKKTIGEVREEHNKTIGIVASIYNMSPSYKDMLLKQSDEILDQYSKAASIGKIYQEMLLQFMSQADIIAELKRRMMNVEVTFNEED